ncbi:MAG: NADH-quinone oxidoreductase subunit C [Holosporales bacterium]|nr:NADH-quinone oxidoreductase subunit C [Holosporales bacterium]
MARALLNVEKNIIRASLGNDLISIIDHCEHTHIRVPPNSVIRISTMLSSNDDLLFSTLMDSFAVDMTDKEEENKFELYYHLYSKKLNKRIFITTEIGNEAIHSLTVVFENINWYEREMFDMFGIKFSRHPDLRAIY